MNIRMHKHPLPFFVSEGMQLELTKLKATETVHVARIFNWKLPRERVLTCHHRALFQNLMVVLCFVGLNQYMQKVIYSKNNWIDKNAWHICSLSQQGLPFGGVHFGAQAEVWLRYLRYWRTAIAAANA